MDAALGFAGWGVTAVSLGMAGVLRARLARGTTAVARAMHELRGPLTAARLGLELGLRGLALPPARLRAIELELGRATLALDDLAAGTAHRVARQAPVDLGDLAADSVEAWRAAAQARGGRVRLDRAAEPVWVHGERLRLAQAIGNLIANGIEHGGGQVEVRVHARHARARIEVVDAGRGLPAPIDRLRRRYRPWRAHAPERGHGLAIASAIASAHGGRLAAAPSERGARLVLELPAAEPPSAEADEPQRL